MTILKRVADYSRRLELVGEGVLIENIQRDLLDINSRLCKLKNKVTECVKAFLYLKNKPRTNGGDFILVNIPEELNSISNLTCRVEALQIAFDEVRSELRQNVDFNCLKDVDDIITSINSCIESEWKNYISSLEKEWDNLDTSVLDARSDGDDNVKKQLNRFTTLKDEFKRFSKDVISSDEKYLELEGKYTDINTLIGEIDWNIPEDVMKFLKLCKSSSGCSLELFNERILDWIKENDDINRFTIHG